MRRTVTIEIDPDAFSGAYRTMTGEEAKSLLVMLVCGGHAVASHSGCLRDVGIRPAPPACTPSAMQAEIDGKVARAAEGFLAEMSQTRPSEVMGGLADRPKPGDKQRARAAFTRLLKSIHGLRTTVEYSRPLQLVPSDGAASAAPRK